MYNKYLNAFLKDGVLRSVCILSVIGLILCPLLIRLQLWQNEALKDIQLKQAVIDRIPFLQSKIGVSKVIVKGRSLTLNGIISNKGQNTAVINGAFFKIGQEIEGKRIMMITGHSVILCDVASKCINLDLEQ